ncbi:PREDICTED: galactose oxidase-like [Fragaria vesca subsp. vesca]|uniref:galactose oxidase-like n=1 Tax=Fragaria vesca subsp. vesca TaxID=101020 RepID=UPI0002C2F0A6|nr:PREDICTED: galactose oxidase-like [Fragaria vesca subsp. vesca]
MPPIMKKKSSTPLPHLLILSFLFISTSLFSLTHAAGGKWQLLLPNVGISAMHMQLLKNDRVVMFDRTDFGKSNLSLPNGVCRNNPNDTALKVDCTAHSAEYDVAGNKIRPLFVYSDVWCSSGSVNPSGTLVQTGGFNDGEKRVRTYDPCATCDWKEIENALTNRRWYATNHILPDGRQIIIGGRRQFNYEFYPKSEGSMNAHSLPFLVETSDGTAIENNLYPFVFLNVDGNLFIFANNRAILFDYAAGKIVKTYPTIPGGDPRSYPSTGSAVLLPLKSSKGQVVAAEVLVCGGAPKGSYVNAESGTFVEALKTCARIKITDPNPQWVMETMPLARVMGDMTLLANGDVLIINGAGQGTAGWELGRNPVLNPVVYKSDNAVGSRFEQQNPSTIPRMYHSTAILLRDGRVLVGGSNPHIRYEFSNVMFPTELALEAFSPSYLESQFASIRPSIFSPLSQVTVGYGQKLAVRFSITGKIALNSVSVTMVSPSFTTHSFSMNQRLLVLASENVIAVGNLKFEVQVTTPATGNLAPSGYYLLYVVHQQIPSEGIWVKIQ